MALLDAVVKAVPGIKDHRARQQHAEIGAALLRFYNQANRMLISGESLIETLRRYEHAASSGSPANYSGQRALILAYVRQQIDILTKIQASFLELASYLGPIIENHAFRELYRLFDIKRGALNILHYGIRENHLILDMSSVQELIEQTNTDVKAVKGWVNVPLGEDFGPQYLPIVQAYFRTRNPEAELEQISSGLEKIRKAILENFKLEDVLLKVKDDRASDQRTGKPIHSTQLIDWRLHAKPIRE